MEKEQQDFWNDKDLHTTPDQLKRQKSASEPKLAPIGIDTVNKTASFKGSSKTPYETSLYTCTCRDYFVRRLPCKHMYRLANELGEFFLPNVKAGELIYRSSSDKHDQLVNVKTGEIKELITKEYALDIINSYPNDSKELKNLSRFFNSLSALNSPNIDSYTKITDESDIAFAKEMIKLDLFQEYNGDYYGVYNTAYDYLNTHTKPELLDLIKKINVNNLKEPSKSSSKPVFINFIVDNFDDDTIKSNGKPPFFALKASPDLKQYYNSLKLYINSKKLSREEYYYDEEGNVFVETIPAGEKSKFKHLEKSDNFY